MRITFPMLLMSTRDFGDWTGYLPRNPGSCNCKWLLLARSLSSHLNLAYHGARILTLQRDFDEMAGIHCQP
jgi:hypothetical protein